MTMHKKIAALALLAGLPSLREHELAVPELDGSFRLPELLPSGRRPSEPARQYPNPAQDLAARGERPPTATMIAALAEQARASLSNEERRVLDDRFGDLKAVMVEADDTSLRAAHSQIERRTIAALQGVATTVSAPPDPRDQILERLLGVHPLGPPLDNFAKLSPEQKHAWATRGQKLRTDVAPCAMCGLAFTFERPGCHDYADRHVHVWCEQRKPTPERAEAISIVSNALAESGWKGTAEERDARAAEMISDVPDHRLVGLVRSRLRELTKAEAKRHRKALAWAKQRRS